MNRSAHITNALRVVVTGALLLGLSAPLVRHACAHMQPEAEHTAHCDRHTPRESEPCPEHDGAAHDGRVVHAQDAATVHGACCALTVQSAPADAMLSPRSLIVDPPVLAFGTGAVPAIAPVQSISSRLVAERAPPRSVLHALFLLNAVFLN